MSGNSVVVYVRVCREEKDARLDRCFQRDGCVSSFIGVGVGVRVRERNKNSNNNNS